MNNDSPNYKRTLNACNFGGFLQSATMNLPPFLFIPLNQLYGITYTQIGFLVFLNFAAQFGADVFFGHPINKYGYRPFCISSQFAVAFGLILLACAPWLLPDNVFLLLVIAIIILGAATGLMEALLSPITKAIPSENSNDANFMIMHTSFAGGIFAAALFTSLMLYVFGTEMWQLVVFLWAILPLANAFMFLKAPLPAILSEDKRMKIGQLLKNWVFIISFFAIFFGASTELLIVQWGSSYLEEGLGIPKMVGDIGGMCLFAAMLGLGRILYAKEEARFNLNNLMIFGSLACVLCYLVVAAAPNAWMVLAAFGFIGFFSCMLWTGTLIVAADSLPNTGVVIFALLAGGGDLGTAMIGQAVGWISDFFAIHAPAGVQAQQYGLKAAISVAIVVPLLSLAFQVILKKLAPHKRRIMR
ncbi:MAG: MFS transporter [Eubacteriales bacterium]|nr:MFS transporter [Eubacteriales bacterium]